MAIARWTPTRMHHNAWFPGRHIGGAALIAGPTALFAGLLLRYLPQHMGLFTGAQQARLDAGVFAAPSELAAFEASPALVTAGYAVFLAGAVLLWPAVATLSRIIGARAPVLALCGGTLIIFGLFARAYAAGVEQTAFHLVEDQGLAAATDTVLAGYQAISYGPWRIAVWCSVGQMAGGVLLLIGAYRSGLIGTLRLLLLLPLTGLWMGVLKGVQFPDLVWSAAFLTLCAFLGVRVLRDQVPELRTRTEEHPEGEREPLRLLSW